MDNAICEEVNKLPPILEQMYRPSIEAVNYHFSEEKLANLIDQKEIQYLSNFSFNFNFGTKNEVMPIFVRSEFITKWGIFGLPTKQAVEQIDRYVGDIETVWDFGCGHGYLAYALNKINPYRNVIAVDNYEHSYHGHEALNTCKKWVPILQANIVELSKKIRNSCVILNWPDMNDTAYKTVSNLHESNMVLYIGEGHSGCTANYKFHEGFDFEELGHKIHWFSFACIHDQVYRVYKSVYPCCFT